MFNKTIFKQTLRSNFNLWLIITVVLCLLNAILIGVFDPKTISSMSDMVKDTPLDKILGNTTFLGMLSQTFYSIHGVILPLIYIIITASNLIVSQVDRGSMAYLLSTPTKRSEVVVTRVIYFVTSLFTMFVIMTISGILSIQAFHGGIWGEGYTEDVKATSEVLDVDKANVADDLTLVLNNKEALKSGAKARGIDEDAYTIYLNLKMTDNADKAALEKEASIKQSKQMQDKMLKGLVAASEVLGIEESELSSNMVKLKSSDEALKAAVDASGIPQAMFNTIINNQIAANILAEDNGIDFNLNDYLMLNLGLFLLMFATGGISFMFSCIFNLSKNYMALGAGIPLAFFLLQMMGQVSDNLEDIKYITLNSLFDTKAIINGGDYLLQFVALAVIGVVLYNVGIRVFKEKDLPL